MSSKKLVPYNINDVNKKILAKSSITHSPYEYLSYDNQFRDDEQTIYIQKREEFIEAVRKYRGLNKNALKTTETKLDSFSDGFLSFLPECDCDFQPRNLRCYEHQPNATGLKIRKRLERPIHKVDLKEVDVCSLESWFKRYLKLSKFIQAGRTIILKNRLLKNLAMLKEWGAATVGKLVAGHKKYDNVSYSQIFERFI